MSVTFTISVLFVGVILGLRFRAFVLIPASAFSSGAVVSVAVVDGMSPWPVLLAVLLSLTALQMGYLAGAVIHLAIEKIDFSAIVAAAQRILRYPA